MRKMTLQPLYKNPFPETDRIMHNMKYCGEISVVLSTSVVGFGQYFNLNNVYQPQAAGSGAANKANAFGFDQMALRYDAFYVPESTFWIRFRRTMKEDEDNYVIYVGYFYYKDSNDVTAFGNQCQAIRGDDTLAAYNAQNWKEAKGCVCRRFGINDSETGLSMTFNYKRRTWNSLNSLDADSTTSTRADFLNNAIGRNATGTWAGPTEIARIVPFMYVFCPVAGTVASSTETEKTITYEVGITYKTVWGDQILTTRDDSATNNPA